jgi:hypothetical protein
MVRKLLLVGFAMAAFTVHCASSATAAPISLNNPYRSFNLTGVNYASVQWQRSHPQPRMRATHSGGWRLFRRR